MCHSLVQLMVSFSKVGLVSLGGGNSMLKLLESEAVHYYHWVEQEEFVRMIGSSFLFPGLTAVKLSALIGYKVAGILGLFIAITCLNLPGLVLVLFGYRFLTHMNQNANVQKIMTAVQYGALALLASATYSIAQSVINTYSSFAVMIACLIFFLALTFLNLSPFWGFLGFIGICFLII